MSGNFFIIAFSLYIIGCYIHILAVRGGGDKELVARRQQKWGRIGFATVLLGWAAHLAYFFTRWNTGGHIPISNMYEFMTFLGMMIVFAYLVIYLIYRSVVVGIFAVPTAILILTYAAVFPQDIQPLIPALQSYWLKIHVTTAATGEAFFAIGFAAGIMYLLRSLDLKSTDKSVQVERKWLEFTLFFLVMIMAFIISVFSFNAAGYGATFNKDVFYNDANGQQQVVQQAVTYVMPPIIAPSGTQFVEMKSFLGMDEPLVTAPAWMKGNNAGRQLNTILWTVINGLILYGLLRLVFRKPLYAVLSPALRGIDPEDLDEISYRAIAIGYPIFTLGALIFAMIWAHEAWGRFWGWDPKEVWALITWLYYAAFLHLRLSRGWHGRKSAWLALIGFLVVMFTLIGVNLVISGLHSYAGV